MAQDLKQEGGAETAVAAHDGLLLGVRSPWQVRRVDLRLEANRVEVEVEHDADAAVACPQCGRSCTRYDHAPARQWRHLDVMQFTTIIRARAPRCQCPEHGVVTVQVPWAEPHGRFTLMFEALAVTVIVYDRFHVAKHLNEAGDKARREEHRRFLMTFFATGNNRATRLWAAPPAGPARQAPTWLLRLATVCAGRRLNESAKLVSALDEFDRFADLRREIAALPDDAPYAAWGKWFLSTDPARPIAPGFTIAPAEAEKLAKEMSAPSAAPGP